MLGALVQCPRCGLTWAAGDTAHRATHRRETVVFESSMDTNRRGWDFQPGQVLAGASGQQEQDLVGTWDRREAEGGVLITGTSTGDR